jgi:hypothetical protein
MTIRVRSPRRAIAAFCKECLKAARGIEKRAHVWRIERASGRGLAMLCFQIVGWALTIMFLAALVPTDRAEP